MREVMKLRRVTFIITVLIALIAAGCTQYILPRGTATIQGVVIVNGDEPGNVDVFVQAVGTRFKTKVNPNGTFALEVPAPASYVIQTTGTGIGVAAQSVKLKKGDVLTGIVLETLYLPPAPTVDEALVWFDFEDGDGLTNAGTWGGQGVIETYVAGQEPRILAGGGLGGSFGLDLSRAGHSGARSNDHAGGIFRLEHPGQDYPDAFTVTLWFKPTDPFGYERIYDFDSNPRLDLSLIGDGGKLVLESALGAGGPRGITGIVANKWHFVAAVVDRVNGKYTVYLGGEEEAAFTIEFVRDLPQPFTMGHDLRLGNLNRHRPMKGYMDEVAVWGRALSAGEIEALWREGLSALGNL